MIHPSFEQKPLPWQNTDVGNSIGFYYTLCKYCTVYIHTSLCKNCPHLRCNDKNYHVFQKISEITIRRDFT